MIKGNAPPPTPPTAIRCNMILGRDQRKRMYVLSIWGNFRSVIQIQHNLINQCVSVSCSWRWLLKNFNCFVILVFLFFLHKKLHDINCIFNNSTVLCENCPPDQLYNLIDLIVWTYSTKIDKASVKFRNHKVWSLIIFYFTLYMKRSQWIYFLHSCEDPLMSNLCWWKGTRQYKGHDSSSIWLEYVLRM